LNQVAENFYGWKSKYWKAGFSKSTSGASTADACIRDIMWQRIAGKERYCAAKTTSFFEVASSIT
jgi:hypothetical protein